MGMSGNQQGPVVRGARPEGQQRKGYQEPNLFRTAGTVHVRSNAVTMSKGIEARIGKGRLQKKKGTTAGA